MAFRFVAKQKLYRLPKTPGVYGFKNSQNQLLYLGKAANLRKRVKDHFQRPGFKENLWLSNVAKIGYCQTDSEVEALLLESRLIKKYQPKFNVMWRDDKNYFYVAITKEQLPRVFITHQPLKNSKSEILNPNQTRNSIYIGPFVDGASLKTTLKLLRRIFPYYTQRQHPKLKCSWCHLGLCPGPNPDPKSYRYSIKNLAMFLRGKKKRVLSVLKKQMNQAAKNLDYEKAGQIKNQLTALTVVMANAKLFSRPILPSQSPAAQEELAEQLAKFLGLENLPRRLEAFDVSNIQGQQATASMVVFIDGQPAKKFYRKFKIKIEGRPNDVAMLSGALWRRFDHPEWHWPDVILVDGGRAQLNAAWAVIKNLKSKIKNYTSVVALAKKKEELYLPSRSKPIAASALPRKLFNLFLSLRDEAHRFAIAYHRKLRAGILH